MSDNVAELLRDQLIAAAGQVLEDDRGVAALLEQIAGDIRRADLEPLHVVPVGHHSPASALQVARLLRERAPRVIYLEAPEDMRPLAANFADCTPPVAMQAFAASSATIPAHVLPVSIIAPMTEASAEWQAIAYALTTPGVELVFVDLPSDRVLTPDAAEHAATAVTTEGDDDGQPEAQGRAIAAGGDDLLPTFGAFLDALLEASRTRHFAEWRELYVERAGLAGTYADYRALMLFVGSLMRRVGRQDSDRGSDEAREAYMWARIRQHLGTSGIPASEAIFICGASHAVTDIRSAGSQTAVAEPVPPAAGNTAWQYGIIPASFSGVDAQFGLPTGTTWMAEQAWQRAMQQQGVKSFTFGKASGRAAKSKASAPVTVAAPRLLDAPPAVQWDDSQLVGWCTRIVALAREHGYLASTADTIAIYNHTLLLTQMRDRPEPLPSDFADAAVLCLDKGVVPKRRTIAQLCRQILGGDRTGTVGYSALPPLVQDLYTRLAPLAQRLGLKLDAKSIQQARIDYMRHPDLRAYSDILWRVYRLAGSDVVRPIVGQRTLGHVPVQESWDLCFGKQQKALIELGYEGVTVEAVLELRLQRAAFGDGATAATALAAAEDSILYLDTPGTAAGFGRQATFLLTQEPAATDAPDIFTRARRLVQHFRTVGGVPAWLGEFVSAGYAHYGALLPRAFTDQHTDPQQLASMLTFIFTLESLALSLGCDRNQVVLAIGGVDRLAVPPDKAGLLWAAEWLLGMRDVGELRVFVDDLLGDPGRAEAVPAYAQSLMAALAFAPGLGSFAVEFISRIFAELDDAVLVPMLPGLLQRLRSDQTLLKALVAEAAAMLPSSLAAAATWSPPWAQAVEGIHRASLAAVEVTPITVELRPNAQAAREALLAGRDTHTALASLLGLPDSWPVDVAPAAAPATPATPAAPALRPPALAARQALADYPETLAAVASLFSLA